MKDSDFTLAYLTVENHIQKLIFIVGLKQSLVRIDKGYRELLEELSNNKALRTDYMKGGLHAMRHFLARHGIIKLNERNNKRIPD